MIDLLENFEHYEITGRLQKDRINAEKGCQVLFILYRYIYKKFHTDCVRFRYIH